MTGKLKKHSAERDEEYNDNEEQGYDPRWEGLKNIQIDEDN